MDKNNKYVVISVGGSLIVPNKDPLGINIPFLEKLKKVLESFIKDGYKFIIIPGGGRIARKYQEAAKNFKNIPKKNLDWIGIHSTRLNAHLLRIILSEYTDEKIIIDPTKELELKEKISVAGGWKPGSSTDYCAVMIAKQLDIKKVVNLTDIDYVYDKNPKENKDAKPFSDISWDDFLDLLPKDWKPGLSSPFDPIASKEAKNNNVEVAIINGNHLNRFEDYLNGNHFKGTKIM